MNREIVPYDRYELVVEKFYPLGKAKEGRKLLASIGIEAVVYDTVRGKDVKL